MTDVRARPDAVFAIEQLDPRTRIVSACAIVLGAVASLAGCIAGFVAQHALALVLQRALDELPA